MWNHLFPTNVEEHGDKQKNRNLSRKITKTVLTSAEDCVFVKDSIRHSTILTWHVSFMFLCTYYFVNSVWPPHSSAILCLYVTWILLNLFHLCDCVLPLPTMSGDSRHYWNKKSSVKITETMKRGELWAVKMEQNCQGRGNTIASSISLKQNETRLVSSLSVDHYVERAAARCGLSCVVFAPLLRIPALLLPPCRFPTKVLSPCSCFQFRTRERSQQEHYSTVLQPALHL